MKRPTLVLLGAVAALLLFIFLFERKQRTTGEIEEARKNVFPGFPEKVVSIRREGSRPLLLEKTGDEWRIKEPIEDHADGQSVEGFLETLRNAKAERLLSGGDDPVKLGFSEPFAVLALRSEEGETRLVAGTSPPGEKGRYFKAGDRQGVMSDLTLEAVERSVNDFRSKELCSPLRPDGVRSLSYLREGRKVFEIENPKGQWTVKVPYEDLAEPRKAFTLVEDAVLWPVMSFEEGQDGSFGLDRPAETLELVTFEGNRVEIRLGAVKDAGRRFHYASVSGRKGVFVISKNSVRNLEADPEALRSLSVFPADIDAYETIEIEKGGRVTLKKEKEKGWEGTGSITPEQARAFLYAAEGLSGSRKAEGPGSGKPFARVVARGPGRPDASVDLRESGEGLRAGIAGRDLWLEIGPEEGERFKSAIGALFTQSK